MTAWWRSIHLAAEDAWRMAVSVPVVLSIVSLASFSLCAGTQRTPVVQTKLGAVQGIVLSTVWNAVPFSTFKGIPFAKPPVGDLRFKAPVSPSPWNGVHDASKESNPCPQIDLFTNTYMGREDCLYLTVYTPERKFDGSSTGRAVMVFVYPGAYSWGYTNTTFYGPDFFMEEDVVLVSTNHRLGPLGFLSLNLPGALGNAGLKDQVKALEWVRGNIAAFGGDPNQVTLFGESSGSGSVSLHLLSERSKGLFQRSISESGSPLLLLYQSPADAISNAAKLSSVLGFQSSNAEEILRFLHTVPAYDMIHAADVVNVLPSALMVPFIPTKENASLADPEDIFLSECPITLYQTGRTNKGDMMLGFTDNEILTFASGLAYLVNRAADVWDATFTSNPLDRRALYKAIDDTSLVASRLSFYAPIDLAQRFLVRNNDGYPVYYYVLLYDSPYDFHKHFDNPINGTGHYDEVPILFNIPKFKLPKDPQDPVNQFRSKLVKLWTNFAKYGNPTPKHANPLGDVIWEPSGKAGRMLNISKNFRMLDRSDVISEPILLFEKLLDFVLPFVTGCNEIIGPMHDIDLFA